MSSTDADGNVMMGDSITEDVEAQECCDEDPVEFEDACTAADLLSWPRILMVLTH